MVTAEDLPEAADKVIDTGEGATNLKHLRGNVLAGDKALYQGHAIAAVAATSPHIAEEALSLIEVDYEVLPPVLNVVDGMKEDAPILHEDLRTEEFGEKTDKVSNIAVHSHDEMGGHREGVR